jgi:hypothetical protein
MTYPYTHMSHVTEHRLPELLLAPILHHGIILAAQNSQMHRAVNHYPSIHDRVLGDEMEENL